MAKRTSKKTTVDVLGFGPHPDDIEITSGGFFLKMKKLGYRTAICDLTRGESATRGTPEIRAREAARAAKLLGLSQRICLGLPDGELQVTMQAKRMVAEVVRQLRPAIVVAPFHQDSHPDHAHASTLVTEGCFIAGLRTLDLPGAPHRPKAILYAEYHRQKGFWPHMVVETTAEWAMKKKIMACYASQFYKARSKEPRTNISRPDFFSRIEARSRAYGDLVGVEYGEAFMVKYPLKIDDPVKLFSDWTKFF